MGLLKCDHIKCLITLTSDYIKRLSLYYVCRNKTNHTKCRHGGRVDPRPDKRQARSSPGSEDQLRQHRGDGRRSGGSRRPRSGSPDVLKPETGNLFIKKKECDY